MEFECESPNDNRSNSPDTEPSLPRKGPSTNPSEGGKSFWGAIKQEVEFSTAAISYLERFRHSVPLPVDSPEEEIGESVVQGAWNQVYGDDDCSLFSPGVEPAKLVSLHPQPASILWLWQIYLDNIDPVLKITHAPSLQRQIIEASSNLSKTSPALQALIFAIYCAALFSITDEECLSIFGESKNTLNLRYQNGCRHALVSAGFLRTSDLQVLAALFLFLLSMRQNMDPRSLSALTGIAVRIAQRMGLHTESQNKTFNPFQAELRRRLWWQIVLLDSRTGDMADYKASTLVPTWDCKLPLNVNDSDLSVHSKGPLSPGTGPTEALLIMIRTEIAEFVRHAHFHLDFASPFLKSLASDHNSAEQRSVEQLEHMIENKYLIRCDAQIPMHFIAICMGRSLICKWRLSEHFSKTSNTDRPQPEAYRDNILRTAIRMIELDTTVRTSTLKGFLWVANFHFPFPAYVYLAHELNRRTTGPLVDHAWEVMSANYDARKFHYVGGKSEIYKSFGQMLLKAWKARESSLAEIGALASTPPRVISMIRAELATQRQPGLTRPGSQGAAALASSSRWHPAINFRMDAASTSAWASVDSTPAAAHPEDSDGLADFGSIDWMFMTDMVGHSLQPGGPYWDTTRSM